MTGAMCGSVAKLCLTLCDPMDHVPPDSSVHGILQEEYWSGQSFSSPGDLPNPGIKPWSPALQVDSLPAEPPGKPNVRVPHAIWEGKAKMYLLFI